MIIGVVIRAENLTPDRVVAEVLTTQPRSSVDWMEKTNAFIISVQNRM